MYLVVVIQRLLGLVTTYFLIRVLSESQFAEYNLIISYLSLLAVFALPGLGNAVVQSTARQVSGIYLKAQQLTFWSTIAAGLIFVLIAFAHKYSGEYSPVLYIGLFYAAFLFPFYRGITIWKNYRAGLKKFRNLSFLNSGTHIATQLVTLILLIFFNIQDYLFLVIVYMFIPSVVNIFMLVVDYFSCIKGQTHELEEGIISYGLKTSVYSAIHTVSFRLDHFILFYFIAPEALAVFAVANRIPEMMRGVTQTLASVLLPRFARYKTITHDIRKSVRLYSIGFGFVVLLVTFTIYPIFMTFLFGHAYDDAILYSQVLMCLVIIGNSPTIYFKYIQSQKDSGSFKNIVVITSIVRVITVLILVPLWGIWGAVASVFFHRVTSMLVIDYMIKNNYTIKNK